MKICMLCNNTDESRKIIKHHLSYDPEIIVLLCTKCHMALHSATTIPKKIDYS